MKKVKIGLLLVTFCAASIFAQEGTELSAPATDSTATNSAVTTEPAPAAAIEPVPAAVTEPVPAAATEPAPVVAAEPAPEAATDSTQTAEAAAEPPVATEQIPIPEPEKVVEQPVEPPPAPAVVVLPPVAAPKEPLDIKFHFGTKFGLGISALRDHKALKITEHQAIQLQPAFSLGGGIAFAIEINSLFSVAPELQYTWYRANGEYTWKAKGSSKKSIPELNEAGTSLHSFELPILARFSFGSLGDQVSLYAEVGPQIGYNYYASIYKNSDKFKPEINAFTFGPSLGFGANVDGTLLGIRGHFGMLEYAKNTEGYPWAVHVSATRFFF